MNGEWVMSWPISDPRTLTVADMLGHATADLGRVLDEERLEQTGSVVWQVAVVRGRLTLTAKLPVHRSGQAVDSPLEPAVSRKAG